MQEKTIWNSIREDIIRYNYSDRKLTFYILLIAFHKFGFIALLNYRIGKQLRNKSNKIPLLREFIWGLTGLTKMFVELFLGISISYHSKIGAGMCIAHFSNIMIGDGVVIGSGATIHQGVTIGVSGRKKRGLPVIGDNFFAGANAVIVGPIVIGDNVIVSANTLAYKNIASNSVVSSHKMEVISQKGSKDA